MKQTKGGFGIFGFPFLWNFPNFEWNLSGVSNGILQNSIKTSTIGTDMIHTG